MLSSAEAERLRTWAVDIALAFLPEGTELRDEGSDVRFSGSGGLSIHRATGMWFSFSANMGGYSAVRLIRLLTGYSEVDAEKAAVQWLKEHPGTGRCDGVDTDIPDDGVAAAVHKEVANEILAKSIRAEGTLAEQYLRSRNIPPPYPDCVRFIENARVGDTALLGILTSHSRTVGIQVGYLDAFGNKSLVLPQRRRFMLEKAPDAIFEISPAPAPGVKDIQADLIIAEGLEDGLSVRQLNRSCRIVGLPGIGTLRHITVPPGHRVTVLRDGDDLGSAADKGRVEGVDHLLLQGASIRVTDTPANADANSIVAGEGGLETLGILLREARPADLSPEGEAARLARLDRVAYDQERRAAADKHGLRVGTLDKMVAEKRKYDADDDPAPGQGSPVAIPAVEPWPDPVDGAALLEGLARTIKRYVIVSDVAADAMALWIVRSHAHAAFDTNPPLWLRSVMKRSGKTRTCEALDRTAASPLFITGITASALLRVIEQHHPTIILDELDVMFNKDREMREVLRGMINSSFDRKGAWFVMNVPLPGGGYEPRKFSTYAPLVLSGIGNVPDTVRDRAIPIEMRRKLKGEKVARLRRRDGRDLEELARKAARFASDHVAELASAEPEVFRTKSKKPGGELHYLPITSAVAAILSLERGHHPEMVFTYVCVRNRYDPRSGTLQRRGERHPFTHDGWRKEWGNALTAAGIQDFRYHDLRHSAGTRALHAHRNLRTVQRMLGHKDIKTTLRYTRSDVDDVRVAMEEVDKAQSRHTVGGEGEKNEADQNVAAVSATAPKAGALPG